LAQVAGVVVDLEVLAVAALEADLVEEVLVEGAPVEVGKCSQLS
jgi:hypothetical protein